MSERSLGDDWADLERAAGAFVMKLPASTTAGIPDWLHVKPGLGIGLVEAKQTQGCEGFGLPAFALKQLSGAQRWILRTVARFGGRAQVLILDSDGYMLLDWADVPRRMSWRTFRRRMVRW